MGFFELVLLAVGLSMDACAVSICKGLGMKKATIKHGAICGLWFGGFQAIMPLMGFFLGSLFAAHLACGKSQENCLAMSSSACVLQTMFLAYMIC